MLPLVKRPSTGPRDVERGGVGHDRVAERGRLVDDGLAGEGPAVDRLVEALLAAAEDHVETVIDEPRASCSSRDPPRFVHARGLMVGREHPARRHPRDG
jgi:hypothetical protein